MAVFHSNARNSGSVLVLTDAAMAARRAEFVAARQIREARLRAEVAATRRVRWARLQADAAVVRAAERETDAAEWAAAAAWLTSTDRLLAQLATPLDPVERAWIEAHIRARVAAERKGAG